MAKTYYKPQPVAAQTQINWAEVGKNFSDMLSEDKRVKDEKRAALDEMSREAVNVINNVEDGQDATANQWWLAAGGQVQDAMLMSKGLLKSGQITANQFVQMQQNVNDGTDGLIGVFEKFNKDYVLKQERAGCKDPTGVGCSQKLESWAMEQLESMGNFQNTAVVVNPETLMLSVVDLVDGKIVDDPNKVRSINSLQTMAGSEFNKFDLDTATKTFVDKTGTWQQVSNSVSSATRKGIKTITSSPFFKDFTKADIEALKKTGATEEQIRSIQGQGNVYFAAEQQLVQTIMADDLQSTSILTNSIGSDDEGNDYTFSFNKERGANEILMKQEGGFLVPDFTDEKGKAQLKKVEEFIKTDVRNQTDINTTSSIQDDRRTPPKPKAPKEVPTEKEFTPLKTLLQEALETKEEYGFETWKLNTDVEQKGKGKNQDKVSGAYHLTRWLDILPGMEGYDVEVNDSSGNNEIKIMYPLVEGENQRNFFSIDYDALEGGNKEGKIKDIINKIREISVENTISNPELEDALYRITAQVEDKGSTGGGVKLDAFGNPIQ